MYSFDYGYFARTNGPTDGSTSSSSVSVIAPPARSSFDSYLQKLHRDMHHEDLGAYCSQEKFSPEFVTSVKHRYASITPGSMEPIFIAINLHNNEHILPNMATQLLALADTLGHDRIFISIYENGSRDKTKEILHRFNETLNALDIAHRIITDPVSKPEHIHRIEYLAKVRNAAMEPLYSSGEKYGQVLFSNDVFFCLTDVLELLLQARAHGSHLTCGQDFFELRGEPAFYDRWVARDMTGEVLIEELYKISKDDITMAAQMRDRPFQVQCGWNGMVVIDAKVFRGDDGVRFRRSVEGECSASECSLICNDMWRKDFNRLVTVPRVKLTYELRVRNLLRTPKHFPADIPFNPPEVETISFRPGPKKILCHPLNGVDTINPDGPKVYVSP
ncbi:hypothetical protein GGH94_001603 [Coemansia aciculifera]|uniref:Alpha-1,3-mannosyltransferase CMT1 n=1 Tax=Coemansia aciculifera TaxID=417176 RepID=A0A9W8IMJ2_9FUNG|nr:hypothetical protein GGH94_001603 [Coemansia aciculifera]